MVDVVMYATGTCPYCVRARKLLEKKGVQYTEIRVDRDPSLWPEMEKLSGRSTVPQIFVGDYHVGGFDDLSELDLEGKLDPLLGLA